MRAALLLTLTLSLRALAHDDDASPDAGVEAVLPDVPEASEAEVAAPATAAADGGLHYTADLTDEELNRRFVDDCPSLGSMSLGVAEAGRLINGVQMPEGDAWSIVDPTNAWGTQETIDALTTVAREVNASFTDAKLRINHIGRQNGGWLRPHQSHQSGRDVDLGFFYRQGVNPGAPTQAREKEIDLARNWTLIRSLVINADVQFILVDKRVQKVLADYALAIGEKKEWVDKLFLGADTLVKHARRHRDHFHVRFFAPRSQELGARISPILTSRADENVLIHRVVKGDSLGKLAAKYNSTVSMIQKANGLKTNALSVGRTLNVPIRGPCTQCPLPPPLVVPPRLLPPEPDPAT